MILSELREPRHSILGPGSEATDVERLAFKVLQEIVLSPLYGLPADSLALLSRAIKQANSAQYAVPREGIFTRYSDAEALFRTASEKKERFLEEDTTHELTELSLIHISEPTRPY